MTVAREPAAGRQRHSGEDRVALAAFVTYSLLAGGNAVGIRFSNRELAPLWGAGLRFALGAALLLAVAALLRLTIPRGRALTGALQYGALTFGGAFAFAYYALVRMHAGFGQIVWRSCHSPRCCSRCSGARSGSGLRPLPAVYFPSPESR